MSWFDRYIFDRRYYRDLRTRHGLFSVTVVLPINPVLYYASAVLIGGTVGALYVR